MITETLSAMGDWGLSLKPSLPHSVRRILARRGYIVVTPRLPQSDYGWDDLRNRALYGGIVSKVEKAASGWALKGDGLLGIAWDDDYVGPINDGPAFNVDDLETVAGWLEGHLNGLTIEVGGGSTAETYVLFDGKASPDWGASPLSQLAHLARLQGEQLEWRVKMPGVIEVDTILGRQVPNVLITEGPTTVRDPAGLRGYRGTVGLIEDGSEFVTDVVTYEDASPAVKHTTSRTQPQGWTEDSSLDLHYWPESVTDKKGNAAAAQARGQAILNEAVDRDELSVSVQMRPKLPREIRPGDKMLLYSPECDIATVTGNGLSYTYRGSAYPARLTRCFGLTWPITFDFDIWYASNGKANIVKLSPWVQWETGEASLRCSAPSRRRLRRVSMRRGIVVGDDPA